MVAGEDGAHGGNVPSRVAGEKKSGLVNAMPLRPHAMERSAQETIQRAGCVTSQRVIIVDRP